MNTANTPSADNCPATATERRDAADAGVASVQLEGFQIPPAAAAINDRFVSGEISGAQRLEQALALCKGLDEFVGFGSPPVASSGTDKTTPTPTPETGGSNGNGSTDPS